MSLGTQPGLIPQTAPIQAPLPKTQADWERILSQLNSWQQLLLSLATVLTPRPGYGFTGSVTIPKLTVGGVNGTLTFAAGILTTVVAAT